MVMLKISKRSFFSLLLGPICLDCFEEEEEEDGKEDAQQKHVVVCVVLVNVETLPLMMRVVFSWMI